ncbi:hypothetical protein [Neorhizobium alkalisoli]|uniref:Uncharacterized protein n=1 Tax=Neorhizobium alkalisoli TaxID=528178 RepID=A0A561QSL2_9HYPH|nr:hypothetical protein [Neorhizobium alkalisoli]TWF53309.1 hypothetical protein FHW37_104588 [Neorhizobium alkalisoli]
MDIKDLVIPPPEDRSPELVRLNTRRAELASRYDEINAEQRTVHAQAMTAAPADLRKDRVAALIEGARFEMPPSAREQLSRLADERRDIEEAMHELDNMIRDERKAASRVVSAEFVDVYKQIAVEFHAALLAAAKAHAKIGELHLSLGKAGVEPHGMIDPAQHLFGAPLYRHNDAWLVIRSGVDDGHLKASDIPKEFR